MPKLLPAVLAAITAAALSLPGCANRDTSSRTDSDANTTNRNVNARDAERQRDLERGRGAAAGATSSTPSAPSTRGY